MKEKLALQLSGIRSEPVLYDLRSFVVWFCAVSWPEFLESWCLSSGLVMGSAYTNTRRRLCFGGAEVRRRKYRSCVSGLCACAVNGWLCPGCMYKKYSVSCLQTPSSSYLKLLSTRLPQANQLLLLV